MSQELSVSDLISLLEGISLDMEASQAELTDIDARTGDGDLGISVRLGFEAVRKKLPELAEQDVGTILAKSGMVFNSAGASTFGTLMATAFISAGRVMKGRTHISLEDLAAIMTAAVDGIMRRGKAAQGERTMLDALIPARDALIASRDKSLLLCEALSAAADAAERGAESTAWMTAKHGRAGWLQEQSKGLPDAGAVAVARMLTSFSRQLSQMTTVG